METVFSALLFLLVLLFYFSNRRNIANRWCAIAAFIFWLGIAKEAFLYNLVPYLKAVWGYTVPHAYYDWAYSSMTWALYSLAMPSAVIFALHFCNVEGKRPNRTGGRMALVYAPALLLSFFFPPLAFRAYQLTSLAFWIVYTVYNLIFVIAFTVLLRRGVRDEPSVKARAQKRQVRRIVLPPVLYWYLTVFPAHTLGLSSLLKLWQGNVLILSVCLVAYIVTAFREGAMGLRLTGESYQWNSDLSIINKGAEYTGHMLKNQTAKMEWCVENLKSQYLQTQEPVPEEITILSRSISNLKLYMDKIRRQSEAIVLLEEPCDLRALLEGALPSGSADVSLAVPDHVRLTCDKAHMTEVFVNLLQNAAEAARGPAVIEVACGFDKARRSFSIRVSDNGGGMAEADIAQMFTPYFTTKSTEKNFGLGLAYCKNVVEKHGGHIHAESEPGRGTTVIVTLPAKRVSAPDAPAESEG